MAASFSVVVIADLDRPHAVTLHRPKTNPLAFARRPAAGKVRMETMLGFFACAPVKSPARTLIDLLKRLAQLFLGVHDDGTVPGHRFFQRLSRDQQETYSIVAGLHHYFV